jgi:hypothetical protein
VTGPLRGIADGEPFPLHADRQTDHRTQVDALSERMVLYEVITPLRPLRSFHRNDFYVAITA